MCTSFIPREIDRFWKGVAVPPNKLFIDADNLIGIITYIVLQSRCPKLLVELNLVEEFITKATQFTNRVYYMTTIHSGLDWVK